MNKFKMAQQFNTNVEHARMGARQMMEVMDKESFDKKLSKGNGGYNFWLEIHNDLWLMCYATNCDHFTN